MRIEKMTIEHKEEVGLLMMKKFKESYDAFDMLPKKYIDENEVSELVNAMIDNKRAVVLIDKDLIGYMDITYAGELFYNKRGVYTAEWGNCFPKGDLKGCLLLLNYIYDYMNDHKLLDHTISVMENEKDMIQMLFNMSYGSRCLDAHATIEHRVVESDKLIREATTEDLDQLKTLLSQHHQHLRKPPTLIGMDFSDEETTIMKWFEDEAVSLWVMEESDKLLGLMKTVKGESGGCDCSYNDATLGIETTQLLTELQGQGLGKLFIDHVHEYGYQNGFKYLAVDFESMNPTALYFWTKHFTTTVRSLIRSIG